MSTWVAAGVYFLGAGLGSWGGAWIAARQIRKWNRRQDAIENEALLARIRENLSADAARWRPEDDDE